jgi:DNA repair protein RadC
MNLARLWAAIRRGAGQSVAHRPVGPHVPRAPRGFSDSHVARSQEIADPEFPRAPRTPDLRPQPLGTSEPAFPSTGPHGHRQRMREKLLTRGPDALADYELLEMLLFLAFKQGDTKPLAKALINRYGSFANVIAAPAEELGRLRGMGPHAVTAIKLVQASTIRSARGEVIDRPVLNNWDRLMEYLTASLAREKTEVFRVLYLDTKNRLIADEELGRGTVNHTPVYPREVVKRALELHATALILVHNHPSGDPTPSKDDIEMTKEVQMAAGVMGIAVHDHVIVGNGRWVSLRETSLIR